MVQIDTSIYGRQVQPDFNAPLQGLALGQQIASNRQRNRLTEMALTDREGLNQAYAGAVTPDGAVNREKLVSSLAANGLGSAIPEAQASFAQQDRYSSQAEAARLDKAAQQIGLVGQLLNGVNDESTYQQAKAAAQQYGIPLDGTPNSYDPNWVNQTRNMATSAQQQLDNRYRELGLALQTERMGREMTSFGAPIQTSQGFYQANSAGQTRPVMGVDGQILMPTGIDAAAQGSVASAKARGTAEGKSQAENIQNLGQARATANQIVGVIDQAINHPGLGLSTGIASVLPSVPGTRMTDFNAVLDQIKGQAFLQAFESLKGGGQITEVEGTKATQAIARLDKAQSQKEFVKSLQELRGIVSSGLERAEKKVEQYGAPGQEARSVARRGVLPNGRQVIEYTDGTREVIR